MTGYFVKKVALSVAGHKNQYNNKRNSHGNMPYIIYQKDISAENFEVM